MAFIFRGRLCGQACDACEEPLSGVRVVLYAARGEKLTERAVAPAKETYEVLSAEQLSGRGDPLGEGTADEGGRFDVRIDREGWEGDALDVVLVFDGVPRGRRDGDHESLGLAVTTLHPRWKQTERDRVAAWVHCLPPKLWCWILARFGVWTICGRLVTCEGGAPVPAATVRAFDADWLQDDPLGSGTTGADGRFWITYHRSDFERTPLSPLISFELVGGPDVYFTAELGGQPILTEHSSAGRQPGRENVGPCLCVELCTEEVAPQPPDAVPHWQQVEVFDIHPAPGTPGAAFSVEGYAGGPADAFVFGGGVALRGNCPLTDAVTGNPVEYRFRIGEWTWSGPPDDPAVPPDTAPASLDPVTAGSAHVGYVFYNDANGVPRSHPVNVSPGPEGWIRLHDHPVTVPMYDPPGSTAVVNVSAANFLRTFDLLVMNSVPITALHPPKLPGGLPKAEAGRSLAPAEREPVRRYQIDFEVREVGGPAGSVVDSLPAIVLDNSPVIVALNLEELHADACNPVAGAANVHILYTVDHPHLRSFAISISNNDGTVHPPPAHSGSPTVAMPSGGFTPGGFLFRGGAGGPHDPSPPHTGGVPVAIGGDPACAYWVTLGWHTRRWQDPGHSTQILYCK